MNPLENVFVVPIQGKFLIHAPLRRLAALVNHQALQFIRGQLPMDFAVPDAVRALDEQLRTQDVTVPRARSGLLENPLFLGLIPTRGCNLACRYCDFSAPKHTSQTMDLNLARRAVDAYLNLLRSTGKNFGEVHFFGGEPFYAETVVHFVVAYATQKAAEQGMTVHFEAITNGLHSVKRCQWIADHFDTIVLSLDGLADIQNRNRPTLNGRGTFEIVSRNARILSEGHAELIIRACVTRETAIQLPAFAAWISRELRPSTVCFETMVTSPLSLAAGLESPDPWEFALWFDRAACILADNGIDTVLSTADLRNCRVTFCPVGEDALIVSPDGAVDACYLLKEDWESSGLNMRLGRINGTNLDIDSAILQQVRNLTVDNRPLCANCLCRYHCAGGCHVSHATTGRPGQFDARCIQTRLITIATLLRQLDQHALADHWLGDRAAQEKSVWQASDRLIEHEVAV